MEYNTGDQKLYLAAKQYDVTVVTEGNGTASATPARAAANTGITLTATPAADSHFVGWQVVEPQSLTLNGNAFTMPKSHVTVKASFELHSFTEEVADEQYLVSPADCEHDAVYYKNCACGEKGTETFTKANSALNHDWGAWTSNGDDTHTRICNRDASHTETGDCTGGTATCTARAICEICGGEHGELLPHDFTAEVAEEQYLKSGATCTEQAEYYKSCASCGLSSEGTAEEATFFAGNILGHDWGAWTSNGDDTHTRTCNRDASHTETGDCTGGTATCTARAVCDTCGGEHGDLLPHDFTAEVVAEQYLKSGATCTEQAEYYKSCAACGLSSEGTAEEATFFAGNILGHDWGAWTSNGDDTHTRTCNRDASHTETGDCTGGTATCTARAICEICGGEHGDMAPGNHTGTLEWIITGSSHEQKWSCCGVVTIAKAPHHFGDWRISWAATTRVKTRECEVCGFEETKTFTVEPGAAAGDCTLYFETNGGSQIVPVQANQNATINLTPYVPTREGYTFTGWYADAALRDQVTSVRLTGDMTVYAGWKRTELSFADVGRGDWFYEDVRYVCEAGLMNGTSDTRFSPYLSTTRAMIVTILWRLENEPVVNFAMTFADVDENAWYGEAVRWATSSGIVTGYSAEAFGPDDNITREQLAAILYRYTQFKGIDVSAGENTNILSYGDALTISGYAFPAMQWACGAGLMQGADGKLLPDVQATRAQVAAILHRFCENILK